MSLRIAVTLLLGLTIPCEYKGKFKVKNERVQLLLQFCYNRACYNSEKVAKAFKISNAGVAKFALMLKILDFASRSVLMLGVDLPAGRQAQGTFQ